MLKFIIIWSAANRDDDLAPAGVRQTQYAIISRLGLVRLVSLIFYHLATLYQTVPQRPHLDTQDNRNTGDRTVIGNLSSWKVYVILKHYPFL